MKRSFQTLKGYYLPDLPKALPLKPDPTLTWRELVSRDAYLKVFLDKEISVNIEEKVDGSSCAITLYDENIVVRNKDKIIVKGHLSDKPSKKQYAHIWNWAHENIDKFKALEGMTIYGEWMWMQHGLEYNKLPDWFIAFDIFDHQKGQFISPIICREKLEEVGFSIPRLLDNRRFDNYSQYVDFVNGPSAFTDLGNREGVYIKLTNYRQEVFRFKMVRIDFVRGALFNKDKVIKNKIVKKKS